jgi:hypothetical protein
MSDEPALVKTPYKKENYTPSQAREFAKCADPINGPKYFLDNYFFIQHPTRGTIRYEAYDYQKKLLENYHSNRFSVNLLGRQMGKCLSGTSSWINIRNKNTNKEYSLPIGIYYEFIKSQQEGKEGPNIDKYEI